MGAPAEQDCLAYSVSLGGGRAEYSGAMVSRMPLRIPRLRRPTPSAILSPSAAHGARHPVTLRRTTRTINNEQTTTSFSLQSGHRGKPHKMKMRLYHGSQSETVEPQFGLGLDYHDFGKGFYLTSDPELAREWSVYRPKSNDGWVHAYDLDMDGLRALDFRDRGVFAWIAELMKHRDADESAAYRRRAPMFIEKYGVSDADKYDVQVGWRANASYFYIVKAFVRDEVDADCMEDLLKLGDFGLQYAVKTQKAYANLRPLPTLKQLVKFDAHHAAYENRDAAARERMRELIADPGFNRLERLFSDVIREDEP